jgi:hypothetical protein
MAGDPTGVFRYSREIALGKWSSSERKKKQGVKRYCCLVNLGGFRETNVKTLPLLGWPKNFDMSGP